MLRLLAVCVVRCCLSSCVAFGLFVCCSLWCVVLRGFLGCSLVGGLHWFVLDFAGLCVALPSAASRSLKTRCDLQMMKSTFDEITATTTTRNPWIYAFVRTVNIPVII